MLVSPEMMMNPSPPPQEVLDQQWLWKTLLAGFAFVFLLQLVSFDIAGALLTGLLLGFGWIMLRDGMAEMPKYALIYAVLCGLNFFFDLLPLVSELSGRVTRRTELATPPIVVNGTIMTTYTIATKTTSFFDLSLGLTYNAESLSMILAPLCMALGTYLSAVAHKEMQRLMPFYENEWEDPQMTAMPALAQENRQTAAIRNAVRSANFDHQSAPDSASSARDTLIHFTGAAHKLDT
eukprot:gb/GFBE01061632.1/.p1 GENE.gb/GFBE01061632.1/~~gb/GFBE01061632.1/.p1  ORF type:complete len:236 (+),score=53.52 gb/GFBE01061632.1/:1-708(+)